MNSILEFGSACLVSTVAHKDSESKLINSKINQVRDISLNTFERTLYLQHNCVI